MKISDLPQPYRALAELRRKQKPGALDCPFGSGFYWHRSPEEGPFWIQVFKDDELPPIPMQSLEELHALGIWPVAPEPHTVESYRAAIIECLISAGCIHASELVRYFPITKNTRT